MEVDDYSSRCLSAIQSEEAKIKAIDIVSGAPNNDEKCKEIKTIECLSMMQTYGLL